MNRSAGAMRSVVPLDFGARDAPLPTRHDLNALAWWIRKTLAGGQRMHDRGVLSAEVLDRMRDELGQIERDIESRVVRAARSYLPK